MGRPATRDAFGEKQISHNNTNNDIDLTMSAVLKTNESIRLMRHDDLAAVIAIETRAYVFPWSKGIFHDCMRVGYSCWIYEQQGIIQAYAIMSVGVGECHVLNLCVDPEIQRQGIGRRLLQYLQTQATACNVDTVLLEVRTSNHAAIALYKSEGFNEVGKRKDYYPATQGREDAIIFAKAI